MGHMGHIPDPRFTRLDAARSATTRLETVAVTGLFATEPELFPTLNPIRGAETAIDVHHGPRMIHGPRRYAIADPSRWNRPFLSVRDG